MSEIQRFKYVGNDDDDIEPNIQGKYVLYADFAALKDENARLAAEIEGLRIECAASLEITGPIKGSG